MYSVNMQKTFHISEINAIALELLHIIQSHQSQAGATIITLSGDLGAGKTTLVQALAQALGITEPLHSPTFIMYKRYPISDNHKWISLIHGDMYRIESDDQIPPLHLEEIFNDPSNLVCIEWSERIATIVPPRVISVSLKHETDPEKRTITVVY